MLIEEILPLKKNKYSISEIAEILRTSKQKICYTFKNVKTRRIGENKRPVWSVTKEEIYDYLDNLLINLNRKRNKDINYYFPIKKKKITLNINSKNKKL
jgi:predicted transcriptional regulator